MGGVARHRPLARGRLSGVVDRHHPGDRQVADRDVEINGDVQLADIRVAPGDLVIADDTGVCFIPRDYILEVLEVAEKKSQAEDARCKAIDGGIPVPDISRASFGEKS